MADDQHYDVVIIGTGAGGGTLGHRLASNGAKVLWLERGPFLPRERDNWSSEAVFVRGKYLAPEVWYDRHGHEFQPEVNYYVGGNTKFYGAALFRLRPEDFGELRHHGGISPAWPISYDDLEPYYTQAEHLYLVHGQHGEDPTRRPGQRAVRLPAGVPRTADPAAERRPGEAGAAPLPPADRGQPPGGGARAGGPDERLHPLRPGRRLPVPAGRQVGLAGHLRGPGAVAGQRHAGHRRQCPAAGDRRLRTDGDRGRHHAGRRIRHHLHRRHRGGRVRRGELGRPAAEVPRRPAPGRSGQQLRSGRPALHAAQQPRPDDRLHRAQPDPVPEDAGDERLVPGVRRLGLPARRDPDARQVRRRGDPRAVAALGRPPLTGPAVRGAGPPRRRLLALR